MNKLTVIFLFLLCSLSVFGGEIPSKPNRFVNDYVGVLDEKEKLALEKLLGAFEDSTSNQVAIVIEASLNGEDPFERSVNIAEAWGIGDKKKDNGVLIYAAINDRQIFIQVGRGLEGALPDMLIRQIIDEQIKPLFKKQKYYEGFQQGVAALMKASAGEYKMEKDSSQAPWWAWVLVIGMGVLFFRLLSFLSRKMKNVVPDDTKRPRSNSDKVPKRKETAKSRKFGGGSFGGGGAGSSW